MSSELGAMEDYIENPVLQEVEALRGIYGEDNISFRHGNGSSPATITISLDGLTTRSPSWLTLTTKLPSSYPGTHPPKPILRSESFTASQSECLVEEMLRLQTAPQGEVCLYDWFQAMIAVINDYEPSSTHASGVDEENGGVGEEFRIMHGEPLTDRKSVFQAHVALISKATDVDDVLKTLRAANRKVESASHNPLAYRVRGGNGAVQDADDDGEKGAGKVVLYVLQRYKVVNVVVVVSRWFGGIKLGSVRFRHIAKVVGDAMERFKGELECEDC